MTRALALVGLAALLAWTGLGLFAWSRAAGRVTVVLSDEREAPGRERELAALAEQLGALQQDVRALASVMGTNFQAVSDELRAEQAEHAAALALRIDSLRGEVDSQGALRSPTRFDDLLRELAAVKDALRVPAAAGSVVHAPVTGTQATGADESASATLPRALAASSAAVPAPPPLLAEDGEVHAAPPAKARKSFLAFRLPSDDFRFDERRRWTVVPALSRVGFDARTTLHDFTATTSDVAGELEATLARPDDAARARITVTAAALASGDGGRDDAMREHLDVTRHPLLAFELVAFVPAEIDADARTVSGLARGRMSVRGVTEDVVMPVRLSLDDARRLCVEGEMALDLTRFRVPVPSKLGLITMEEEVRVWISLRLRAEPRVESD